MPRSVYNIGFNSLQVLYYCILNITSSLSTYITAKKNEKIKIFPIHYSQMFTNQKKSGIDFANLETTITVLP